MYYRAGPGLGLLLIVMLLAGCATAPPAETQSMKGVAGIDATAREIQVQLYQYASYFAGQIDLATAEIYYGSKDYDVRMAALEWNANAVPEMMRSCFHFDPLTGLLQAGTFAVQMDEFFTTGNGRDLFGDYQHVAVETSGRLRRRLYDLVLEFWHGGDLEDYESKVNAWAREHPIENTRFVRGDFDYETTRLSGVTQDMGMRLAGSMNAQLLAATDRANILMPQVARQVQWEKEMILTETRRIVADVTDSTIAEAMGGLQPILAFLAEQRALTMRDLAQERATVLQAIADERSAVLVAIAKERTATMEGINALSLATLDRITTSSEQAVGKAIDQVFDRLTRLLLICGAAIGVLTIIVMIWVRNTVNRMLARRGM